MIKLFKKPYHEETKEGRAWVIGKSLDEELYFGIFAKMGEVGFTICSWNPDGSGCNAASPSLKAKLDNWEMPKAKLFDPPISLGGGISVICRLPNGDFIGQRVYSEGNIATFHWKSNGDAASAATPWSLPFRVVQQAGNDE